MHKRYEIIKSAYKPCLYVNIRAIDKAGAALLLFYSRFRNFGSADNANKPNVQTLHDGSRDTTQTLTCVCKHGFEGGIPATDRLSSQNI